MPRVILRGRSLGSEQDGFTLIELLVVVLIIGILAAIALPAFLGQRQKSHDATAKSAVRQAHTAGEAYATSNQASYTGMTADSLKEIEPTLNDARSFSVSSVSDTGYKVTVASAAANRTFSITKSSTGVSRTCTPAGGGCRTVAAGVNGW